MPRPIAVSVHCFAGDGYSCDPTIPVDEQWFTNQLLVNPLPTPTASPTEEPSPSGSEDPLTMSGALATGTAVGAVGVLGIAFMVMHFQKRNAVSTDGAGGDYSKLKVAESPTGRH